jgi:hypothetical protein
MDMPKDINEAAELAAGSWRKLDSFVWFDRPEDSENWMLHYTSHRDSDLIAESNEHVINKALEPFEDDVRFERHSHWAVGYVDGFALRVFDSTGTITKAFKTLHELLMAMAEYPLLDDSDHSEREYKAQLKSIENNGPTLKDPPDAWAEEVFSWLCENNQGALEYNDYPYVDNKDIVEACVALGFMNEDDE